MVCWLIMMSNREDMYAEFVATKAKISTVVIAYAFKLLLQEMMSLNVAPRLNSEGEGIKSVY